MAGSLNKVTLIGNVGKDPEIRTTQDGREVANFPIATSDSWKDKSTGEKQERTEWHRVVIFSQPLIGIIKSYVHKGSKLYLEGALRTRKWSDQSGVEKYTTEIVLQAYQGVLMMLDKPHNSNEMPMAANSGDKTPPTHLEEAGKDSYSAEPIDDEIPF